MRIVARDDKFGPLLEPQGSLQLSDELSEVELVMFEYEKHPAVEFSSQDKAGWPP